MTVAIAVLENRPTVIHLNIDMDRRQSTEKLIGTDPPWEIEKTEY